MKSVDYLNWSLLVFHELDSTYESSKQLDILLESFSASFVDNETDFKRVYTSNKALAGIILYSNENLEELVKFVRKTNPKIPIVVLTEKDSSNISLH